MFPLGVPRAQRQKGADGALACPPMGTQDTTLPYNLRCAKPSPPPKKMGGPPFIGRVPNTRATPADGCERPDGGAAPTLVDLRVFLF